MSESAFLSCPFCGHGGFEWEPEIEGSDGDYKASCGYCGASSPRGCSIEEAQRNWNERPVPYESENYKQGFNDAKNAIIDKAKFIGMKNE